MNTILLLIAIAVLILIAALIFFSKIKRFLPWPRPHGVFTKQQALKFSDIYITFIEAEIRRKVDYTIIELLQDRDGKALDFDEKIRDIKDAINSIRGMTAEFKLINNCSYTDFMRQVHPDFESTIDEGETRLMEVLVQSFESGKAQLSNIRKLSHSIIKEKAKRVKDIIEKRILLVYGET